MQVTSMKVGDLFPRPRLRLQADGVGVDLSEAVSVTARVRLPGSTSHVDRDVTVADQDVTANHGIVTVVLIDGDTDFQGTIKFDIEVEWATGVQTWPSRGYFKIWLLEDADSAQGGGPPLVGSSGDPFTLDRIYDVNISSAADNDLLQYDSASARWLNVAPADVRSTLGLGSAALSSTTDFIRSSVTQAGAALTPTAQTLWSFQPADTNRGPFQWVMGGAAFDSVFDPVMYLGYNVADGGVAKSGEASFRTALESHYRNGGVNNFEYYFEYMSGDLVTRRRPFFLQMDKSTGAVNSMQFSANTAYFTQESDEAPYFTISRGNITSAPYAGTPIEWRIKAASAQNSVFTMENSTSVALTIETLSANSAVLRAGSIANENLYLFNNRGIAVNVQDNAAALTVMGGAVGSVAVFRAGSVAGNLTTWQDNASSVLASVSAAGLATFAGVTLTDATNLVFGTSTGTKIGTATSQKLGFYNATPIIRPSGSILTALSSLGLVGSPTLASTALSDTASLAYLASANTFTAGQTVAGSTDTQQLIVKGAVGQTVGLQHWRNSADTTLAYISAVGYAQFAGISSTANAFIDGSADNIQLRVQGHSVQNANLQTWESSAAAVVASVSGTGKGLFTSIGPTSGNFNILDSGGSIAIQVRTSDVTIPYKIIASATTGSEAFKTFGNAVMTVSNAANVPLQVRGYTAQSANLQTWEDSSASVLASISAAGLGTFAGVTSTTGTFSSDVSVGAGSAAVDSLLTINGGTNTGKGGAIAFKRGGSSKGYLGTRSFVIGGSTDDISLISYADLTLGIGSIILMAMSSSANTLNAYSSTAIPVVAKGFSAQTANLQEWQNSSGTALASVSSAGLGTFAGLSSGASITITAPNGSFISQGVSGQWTGLDLKTGTSNRWKIQRNGTAESGSNAGSDLDIYAYMDDGVTLITPLTITRASGAAKFTSHLATGVPMTVKGAAAQTANLFEAQNSSASVLASISSAGLGTFAGVTSTENVAVTKSQSATTRIAVTNGSTNANALAEIRAATDAGYTGLFKHPAAYGGYKILGAGDAAMYNVTAGHMSFLNDYSSGVIRFAAGGASSAQVQIETTGKLTTFTPTTAAASVRLPHGTAPSTPVNGDMWTTDAGLYVHVNGSTVGPLS